MNQYCVAHQGFAGAFAHMAALEIFPDNKILSFPGFDSALKSVSENKAKYVVVPIENSAAGRVADIHSLLPNSGLYIVKEYYQRIKHQLLAVEGTNLEDIKTVHSHLQALSQCKNELKNLSGVSGVAEPNTAIAAAKVAENKDKTKACIASKLAGEIYKLKTLKSNIEDMDNNTTRFLVLAKNPETPKFEENKKIVTSFVFRIRSIPASLYKCLGGFATNGINMTKLESYLVNGDFVAAQFYVDVEAHPDEKRFKYALEELKFFSHEVKILGTYEAHPYRFTAREKFGLKK